MTCPICDQKASHCDCSKEARDLRDELDCAEEEIERLKSLIRKVIAGDWCVTDLQEAIGDV